MCVTFVCTDGIERGIPYKLILINNRDEYLDRPTSAAAWEDGYLAGRDEEAADRGTWLGIDKKGRIGNILSITEPAEEKRHLPGASSRGSLAKNFLKTDVKVEDYGRQLAGHALEYHGFHFVGLELNTQERYDVHCLTNRLVPEIKLHKWSPGILGFGNSPRRIQMRKVLRGEELLTRLLVGFKGTEEDLIDGLTEILNDNQVCFPDLQIEVQTRKPPEQYKYLCSIKVEFPLQMWRYGTRSQTIILVDSDDNVLLREHRMASTPTSSNPAVWETLEHRFRIG